MTITPATELDAVFGGVDSHADTIHVAVITDRGGHVADAEFPTTSAGYAAAIAFLNAHGTVTAIGVEGTSSYGLGFTRAARHAGLTVVEVNRPDKAERRRIGKSDPIDAYAAARAALSGRASVVPKDDGLPNSPFSSGCSLSHRKFPCRTHAESIKNWAGPRRQAAARRRRTGRSSRPSSQAMTAAGVLGVGSARAKVPVSGKATV